MKLYKPEDCAFQPQGPGTANRVLHTDLMTLATWRFDKGAELAVHSHLQEQVACVQQGEMEFQLTTGPVRVRAGEQIVFASNEAHGGRAIETSVVLDVFSSVREDFKKNFVAMQPVQES